jgi:tRNA (cytidine32/uridine32-2'-O)-methyltransferase
MLSDVRIILVGTTHPGNIGAAARAMKTMGLRQLRLVSPRVFPAAEATALAAGADDVLARATVHHRLDEAIADCTVVVGVSARTRSIACPLYTAREGVQRLRSEAAGERIAILFGREHSGLSNEEMDRCHYQFRIPADPGFPSLNVAAAVQIVCYEVALAREGDAAFWSAATHHRFQNEDASPHPGVDAAEMTRFYDHLEEVLVEVGFLDPRKPRHLMRRLRRLFNRAQPDRNEINILRGVLTAVQTYAEHVRRRTDRV